MRDRRPLIYPARPHAHAEPHIDGLSLSLESPLSLTVRGALEVSARGEPVVRRILRSPHPSDEARASIAAENERLGKALLDAFPTPIVEDLGVSGVVLVYPISGYRLLSEIASELTREDCLRLLAELAFAIDSLHARGLVHGNLDPEALLIDPSSLRVAVIDFGLLAYTDDDSARSSGVRRRMIDPAYASAARIQGRVGARIEDDQYAFAAIAYRLLCGRAPRQATTRTRVSVGEALHGELASPSWFGLPESLDPVFEIALRRDDGPAALACVPLARELDAAVRPTLGAAEPSPIVVSESGAYLELSPSDDRLVRRVVVSVALVWTAIFVIVAAWWATR